LNTSCGRGSLVSQPLAMGHFTTVLRTVEHLKSRNFSWQILKTEAGTKRNLKTEAGTKRNFHAIAKHRTPVRDERPGLIHTGLGSSSPPPTPTHPPPCCLACIVGVREGVIAQFLASVN
jgi:hypothetical protein